MGIMKIDTAYGYLVVRARCITCARNIAAQNAGREGTSIWRDPTRSKISVLDHTRHTPTGRTEILERHMQND